jgi:hypothetical protein
MPNLQDLSLGCLDLLEACGGKLRQHLTEFNVSTRVSLWIRKHTKINLVLDIPPRGNNFV